MSNGRFILTICDAWPNEDAGYRMRGLLKRALRSYGFRVIDIEIKPKGGTEPWPVGDNEPGVYDMTLRSIPIPRVGKETDAPKDGRYLVSLIADPTPEALRDDGSVDGVPVRTLEQAERERRAKLAEIERLSAGTASGRHVHNAKPCTLRRDGKVMRFASVKEACIFAGVNHTNLYTILKRKGEAGGYRWRIGA